MFVSKRMTREPITINQDISIIDAMEVLRVSNIRRLPVMDGDRLVGIVTDRDLNAAAPSLATTLSKHEANYLLAKMKISEIMTKKVITVTESVTIEEVALLMYKNKIGGIPVLSNDGNKLVGIITETDIFKVFVGVMGLANGTTRISLTFQDKPGILADIGTIFRDLNINLTNFAIMDDGVGTKEIVLRGNFTETEKVRLQLEEHGFTVNNIIRIDG